MAKIIWTSETHQWLKDIFDYISVEDLIAASSVVEGIYQKPQILEEFPQISYQYEHESERNIRVLLYGRLYSW